MYQQDYKKIDVRPDAILTTSYVAGTVLSAPSVELHMLNQLVFYVNFTIGSLTSAEIKVEFSDDGTNYYEESIEGVPTAGVSIASPYVRQLTASGTYRFAIPVKDKFIRISSKGTGTVTSSSLAITGIVGIA